MERKFFNGAFSLKAAGESGLIEGYGAVFGNLDSYGDVILPAAFTASLKEWSDAGRSVPMLWQHNKAQPIGVWPDLVADDHGLKVSGQLILDVAQAREAHALVKGGAVTGLSIGYSPIKATRSADTGVRVLEQIRLYEISLVTFPANEAALVTGVKGSRPVTRREFEARLREEMGFSKSEAEIVSRSGFKGLGEGLRDEPHQSDADAEGLRDELLAAIKRAGAVLAR